MKNGNLYESQDLQIKKIIAGYSKQIENIQYILKVDRQTFSEEKEKHLKEIKRLSNQITFLNNSLEQTINELNKKEKDIYEIQHQNLEKVFQDLAKIENAKNEMAQQIKIKDEELNEISKNENIVYDRMNMFFEDLYVTKSLLPYYINEITKSQSKLESIKKTYTEEFNFLCEDFVSEQKIHQIRQNMNIIQISISEYISKGKSLIDEKNKKSDELIKMKSDLDLLYEKIDFNFKKNQSIGVIEKDIKSYMNKVFPFNLLKSIITNFLLQKNYIIENRIDLSILQGIYNDLVNAHSVLKNDIEKIHIQIEKDGVLVQSIDSNRKTKKSLKQKENIKQQIEDALNNSLMNQKLLQELEKKIEKYKKYLPCYSIDNSERLIQFKFQESFYDDMFSLYIIGLDNPLPEDIMDFKTKLQVFFSKLSEQYQKNFEFEQKKMESETKIKIITNSISTLEKEIEENTKTLGNNKQKLLQEKSEYEIIIDTISSRSKNIKSVLNKLSVQEFEKYLKLNDNLYKSIIKSGIKVKNGELSITKDEFIEYVILDHSNKKRLVNEQIEEISILRKKIEWYEQIIQEIEEKTNISKNYAKIKLKYENVENEKKVLKESISEIEKSIKDNLISIEKDSIEEKEHLQTENNIPFYKKQIQFLHEKIESIKQEKIQLEEAFSINEKSFIEKNEKMKQEIIVYQNKIEQIISKSNSNELKELITEPIIDKKSSRSYKLINHTNNTTQPSLISGGLLIYQAKKANNVLMINKYFHPEKNGYVLKNFIIDPESRILLMKNTKINQIEKKIKFDDINSIMLNDKTKKIITEEKIKEHSVLEKGNYIPFILLLKEGNLDLLSPNYLTYQIFSDFIQKIVKSRVSKYLY